MEFDAVTSEVKDHATYSASGAARWLGCPGSIKLCEKAPPQRESPYAVEGTEAHACLEFLLKNRHNLKAALFSAARKYDSDMIEHAKTALEWAEDRQISLSGSVLLCEQKVDSSPFTCKGQFGTLDISLVQEFGRLVVIDYKYGAGVAVNPEGDDGRGNPQLIYYALALSHEYDHNFADVELVVIQPRAYHESGDVIRSFVMSMEELLSWGYTFQQGVWATKKPDPKLFSGAWCKFCPAATICPELKTKALAQAQVVFSDTTGVASVPEPKLIQLPNLGTILDACDRLEDWIGKVREHAYHVLERGETVAGFKLVNKKSPRKWVNEERISREATKRFGSAAFTTPKLHTPAQLEKAAKGVPGVAEWVQARVTCNSSGVTLVRDTDKRPAVKPLEVVFAEPYAPIKNVTPLALQGRIATAVKKKAGVKKHKTK